MANLKRNFFFGSDVDWASNQFEVQVLTLNALPTGTQMKDETTFTLSDELNSSKLSQLKRGGGWLASAVLSLSKAKTVKGKERGDIWKYWAG